MQNNHPPGDPKFLAIINQRVKYLASLFNSLEKLVVPLNKNISSFCNCKTNHNIRSNK